MTLKPLGLTLAWAFCLCALALAPRVIAQEDTPAPTMIVLDESRETCPIADALRERAADFAAEGVILTAFDFRAMWHFDVASGRRYPIVDTIPCGRNCHLSPDGQQIVYFNDATNAHSIMRLDGGDRTTLTTSATDVVWWPDGTFFAWTPGTHAFTLLNGERRAFPADDLTSVAPGGAWGLVTRFDGETFQRSVVRPMRRIQPAIAIGEDVPYFNDHAWSPDGRTLAYIAPILTAAGSSAELYTLTEGDDTPRKVTDLAGTYGAVRVNGVAVSALAWSPDSERVAFWVLPSDGDGEARVHIYDTERETITAYCGFTTLTHTPNTPRLLWSPDGDYLAFASDRADDGRGAFLIALDVERGAFTILSEGLYAVYGIPDVYVWGRGP